MFRIKRIDEFRNAGRIDTMIGKVATGLVAFACLVWGTALFVRIVRDQGDPVEHKRWTMPVWGRIACLVLLAAVLVGGILAINAWQRFKDGAVVAQATRNTWTYQLRAYRQFPSDQWLTGFQCEVGYGERVSYMAPFPAGDSPAYKESDCSVSLTESGAIFRVGDNAFAFEWRRDGVAWFRDKRDSGANQGSEGTR